MRKKSAQTRLKTLSTKYVYNIYIKGFDIRKTTMVDMPYNPIEPNHISLIYMYEVDSSLNNQQNHKTN